MRGEEMAVNVVKKEISLNVGQPNNFELILAMQGDNKAYKIVATLYDVNKLYSIASGSQVCIKGEDPVGGNIYKLVDSCTANTVTFTLNKDLLANEGILKLVLTITNSDAKITTFPFAIKIVKSPGDDSGEPAPADPADDAGGGNDDFGTHYKCVVYYETYDEFLKDYKAGVIKTETLVVIKEKVLINGDGSGSDTPSTSGERLYLYKNGDECTSVTGGWTTDGTATRWNGSVSKESFIKKDQCISVHFEEDCTGMFHIKATNKINFNQYKSIYFKYRSDFYTETPNAGMSMDVHLRDTLYSNTSIEVPSKAEIFYLNSSPDDIVVYSKGNLNYLHDDIKYIDIYFWNSSSNPYKRDAEIYEIWLEK